MDTNEYLKPWTTGDLQAQEAVGYEEGYRDGAMGKGFPDGPLESTPYGRGFIRGHETATKDNLTKRGSD